MALTKNQAEGVLDLLIKSFINNDSQQERKKLLIEFEDIFGKSIPDWKTICRNRLIQHTSDKTVLDRFDEVVSREKQTDNAEGYTIRLLEKADLLQVRELINGAFAMCLTVYDEERFEKFIKSGYSIVACNDDEVVGALLAYEMPDYNVATVYIDTFVVAEFMRDCGIGKRLLQYVQDLARENSGIRKIKLQTDKKREAYNIYRHWGFQEDELIPMHKYFL